MIANDLARKRSQPQRQLIEGLRVRRGPLVATLIPTVTAAGRSVGVPKTRTAESLGARSGANP